MITEALHERLERILEESEYTLEQYQGRPAGEGPYYPPSASGRRIGTSWPTGFSGSGYLLRDVRGAVVYAHAFRRDAIEWIEEREL